MNHTITTTTDLRWIVQTASYNKQLNFQNDVNKILLEAPIYDNETFLKAIATNAVLPVAVCPVPGTVVACPGEGTIQLNIEGEVTLHWRQAGIAHTVTWVC